MRYENRLANYRKSQLLTSTKAKEMVNKYEVFYYLNVFGLRVKRYIVEDIPSTGKDIP